MNDTLKPSKYFRELYKLSGHKSDITDLKWAPHGKWLASCAVDGTLNIWTLHESSGRLRATRSYTKSPLKCIAWDKTGQYIACGSHSGLINIFGGNEFKHSNMEYGLSEIKSTNGSVNCLTWGTVHNDPDRQIISFSGGSKIVYFHEITKKKFARQAAGIGHTTPILCIAYAPDSKTIATGTEFGTIGLWEPFESTKETKKKNIEHGISISNSNSDSTLAWLADYGMRGSFSSHGNRLHLLRNVLSRNGIFAHQGEIRSLAWSPENRLLASCANDGFLRMWDVDEQRMIDEYYCGEEIFSIEFTFKRNAIILQTISKILIFKILPLVIIFEYPLPAWIDSTFPFNTAPIATDNGNRLATLNPDDNKSIIIWHIDFASLIAHSEITKHTYTAACVPILGETQSGKSSVARALAGEEFFPTHKIGGTEIYQLPSKNISADDFGYVASREIFLWDISRDFFKQTIHQIDLEQGNTILLILRPTPGSCITDYENIVNWRKSIASAIFSFKNANINLPIVITHCDELKRKVKHTDIIEIQNHLGIKNIYVFNAKTHEGIHDLRNGLSNIINWELTTKIDSISVLRKLAETISRIKLKNRIMTSVNEIQDNLIHDTPIMEDLLAIDKNNQLKIGLKILATQGKLITFDNSDDILLEPNYFYTYSAAIMSGAENDSSGMGRLPLEQAKSGYGSAIIITEDNRIVDKKQQSRLLNLIIMEMAENGIAQEVSTDGISYLVFPKALTRTRPSTVIRPDYAAKYRFKGPTLEIFSALIVRLLGLREFYPHEELWHNEALFTPAGGGGCGVKLHLNDDKMAELELYFDEKTNPTDQDAFHAIVSKHIFNFQSECIYIAPPKTENTNEVKIITDEISNIQEVGFTSNDTMPEVYVLWRRDDTNGTTRANVKRIADLLSARSIKTVLEFNFKLGLTKKESTEQLKKYKIAIVMLAGGLTTKQISEEFHLLESAGCRFIPIILPNAPIKFSLPKELKNWNHFDLRGNIYNQEDYDMLSNCIIETWNQSAFIKPQGKEHIFLSYLEADATLATKLKTDLESAGICVLTGHDEALLPGKNSDQQIKNAIRKSYAFIFCISTAYENTQRSSVFSQLKIAIEVQRAHFPNSTFIIPVKLAKCNIPDEMITETLSTSNLTPFSYFGRNQNSAKLIQVLESIKHPQSP